jgi:hypothetical protein
MTRIKPFFAVAVLAAVVAVIPASAATCTTTNAHYIGMGSSAQFAMSAIAADQAALNENAAVYAGDGYTVNHWSYGNGGQMIDTRQVIPAEVNKIWIVWIQDGSGDICDYWLHVAVDSTVGVRGVLAQETLNSGSNSPGAGAEIALVTTGSSPVGPTSGSQNKVGAANVWPDNHADVAMVPALFALLTPPAKLPHVNVGLTDIRPEDAYFATVRSINTPDDLVNSNTLGYYSGTPCIGSGIDSAQPGSTSFATPVCFALPGQKDPFTSVTVPSSIVTIPIGAGPIVFGFNHSTATAYPSDLATGISPNEAAGPYLLANLYDGTTACTNANPAFDATIGGAVTPTNITLFLREPLSGTMNTTEFTLFRTFGNTTDSQEKGVNTNPLNQACASSAGSRQRAIGTSEVIGGSGVGGLVGTPNSIGYFFWGFANGQKLAASNFNYLTIDGVDPIGPTSISPGNQGFPNCATPTCTAGLWTGNNSYPHIRDGSYKAWSIYRWVTDGANSDPYGPAALAQLAQDYVDVDIADFVPFNACPTTDTNTICTAATGGIGPSYNDGLSVYRSHYTLITAKSAQTSPLLAQDVVPVDGNGVGPSSNSYAAITGAETIGGGTEAGRDEGGLIVGPYLTNFTPSDQWCPVLSGVAEMGKVTKNGDTITRTGTGGWPFTATTAKGKAAPASLNLVAGDTVYFNGTDYTISKVTKTALTVNTKFTATKTGVLCFDSPTTATPDPGGPGPIGIVE